MRWKAIVVPAFSSLFVLIAAHAVSQVVPSAEKRVIPFAVGGGFSSYLPDRGNGRMLGDTLWIDYRPVFLTRLLPGISIEAEAHGIDFNRSSSQPNVREDTFSGGVNYRWSRYRNFRPYGKFLLGYGSIDFLPAGSYGHDTRTVTSTGGGVEYRVFHNVWVRADYEYQFWPDIFGHRVLNPQGVTVGAMYDFAPYHRRR
jgi:hypothetical protein